MQPLALTIFWFRRDLRLTDNAGLYYALQSGSPVLPIFIFDTTILNKLQDKSDARVSFIYHAISQLNQELVKMGSGLLVLKGDTLEIFKILTKSYNIKCVYTNTDYEPYALTRDKSVSEFLTSQNILFQSFKDQVMFEKNEIVKSDGTPYAVYTPYMKQWKLRLSNTPIIPFNTEKFTSNFIKTEPFKFPPLSDIGFIQSTLQFPKNTPNLKVVENYNSQRDYPAFPTTQMGVHLRFGTVSIRKLVEIAVNYNETWLNELIWREFFQMIIYHFPHSANEAFKPAYKKIEWENNEAHFDAWCNGRTGIPLVDAGMRELNITGFMHNRVRMVTASFLCKNLLIDWRWGEAYFAQKLLDYDLASNVGNWQWVAGSGCDAAPYFRIFNPIVQASKFDKSMNYILKWVPEINSAMYPKPLVDLNFSATLAKERYKKALNY